MAWRIGIDEAGYGPNLGPLVMTAVACRVPDEAADTDLWRLLARGVCRHGERGRGRLVVADSKLVYSPTRGLAPLERTVLAALHTGALLWPGPPLFLDLGTLVDALAPEANADLCSERWYTGTTALPIGCDVPALDDARQRLGSTCEDAGVAALFRSVVVCAPRFNDLTDACDSKAAALVYGLNRLIRAMLASTAPGPTEFVVDKHGGRNHYGAMLREAFAGGLVRPCAEGAERSVYAVEGLDRPVRVTILPRADLGHFSVALASMVSKYLREALMREFNAFWQLHVPGLKSTAGYPLDASRFFAEIRSALDRLGLSERQVWRRK
jgi:ribonuclease HII